MRRRAAAAVAAVAVTAVLAYGALDVVDIAPGLLTRAPLPTPAPVVTATPAPTVSQPTLSDAALPLVAAGSAAASSSGPTASGVRRALAQRVVDPRLGTLGAVVRDAGTGAHLLDLDPDTPLVPASTVKLLAAAAIDATFPANAVLTTSVVSATPGSLLLVAGGDTLLAPGPGDRSAVVGRAGLGDLAATTAAALRASGTTSVTVGLDATYAAGPTVAPTWSPDYRPSGITGAVAAIGLSTDRALPGDPGPADPASSALTAFAAALRATGLTVAVDGTPATAPSGARVVASVTSAPVADQLALALQESDNALTESLARQAAFRAVASAGGATAPTTFAATADFVRRTLSGLGIDVSGATTVDASGLSREDRVPPRLIADVLALGATSDRLPTLRETLADLAVGGLSGSLADRFDAGEGSAAGRVRAKTGTLTGVSSLAGTLTTSDGRVLTFALVANGVPASTGTPGAREALDGIVTALASCGCR